MISNEISKRWKDRTARQEIYSGSATRTPSLPYSTPRAPNSRVFFTISTSSLMAEKTLHTNLHTNIHTNNHTTTPSHLSHNFYTPSSNQSTSQGPSSSLGLPSTSRQLTLHQALDRVAPRFTHRATARMSVHPSSPPIHFDAHALLSDAPPASFRRRPRSPTPSPQGSPVRRRRLMEYSSEEEEEEYEGEEEADDPQEGEEEDDPQEEEMPDDDGLPAHTAC
jgi:hypothetical protein